MKNLMILLIALSAMSCTNWYKNGHINEDCNCEFIVNDSTKITCEPWCTNLYENQYAYYVEINDKKVTYQMVYNGSVDIYPVRIVNKGNDFSSIAHMVRKIERKYKQLRPMRQKEADRFLRKKREKEYGCFKF